MYPIPRLPAFACLFAYPIAVLARPLPQLSLANSDVSIMYHRRPALVSRPRPRSCDGHRGRLFDVRPRNTFTHLYLPTP